MRVPSVVFALFVLGIGCNDPTKGKVAATVGSAVAVVDAGPSSLEAGAPALVTYAISPATSKVSFVGSKLTGKHEGTFGTFAGKITVPGGKLEAGNVTLSVDAASLKTDDEELDTHLKSKDFFDVAKFPKATFTSTSIAAGGAAGATHTLTGNLELHGVTRSIGVPATIKLDGKTIGANAEFTIKRKDFGIVYPGKPDDLIKDEVLIKLSITGTAS